MRAYKIVTNKTTFIIDTSDYLRACDLAEDMLFDGEWIVSVEHA